MLCSAALVKRVVSKLTKNCRGKLFQWKDLDFFYKLCFFYKELDFIELSWAASYLTGSKL